MNAEEDDPEFNYDSNEMYVDEDDDTPPARYLYLYDVDTDIYLNEDPYAYLGNYSIVLNSNPEIS